MRAVVGLGNPEREYRYTRHNVGFETINKLAYDHKIKINKAKHRAHLGQGRVAGVPVLLVKPQTYMNRSGECVRDVLRYFRLTPADLIVIYDDTDLLPGQVRVREKGSAGGHNGMKSVIYQLETDEFLRVRIGIGPKPPGWDLADYVLSRFAPRETDDVVAGITKATDAVEVILKDSVERAMNLFNARPVKAKPDAPENDEAGEV